MHRAVAFTLVLVVACGGVRAPSVKEPGREVIALRALARLHGVVRWFHPSDEAAAIDWDRYAVIGVQAVRAARDRVALARALAAWVAPIGPSVQIAGPGERLRPFTADAAAPQVAWQHLGPGFDGGGGGEAYASRRTNRVGVERDSSGWGMLGQGIDGRPLRGHRVRLRARVKAGPRAQVGAWLRVDLSGDGQGFFDNMMDRPVTAATWTAVTIEGPVADDADAVVIGGLAMGGDGWFDDLTLDVDDGAGGWRPLPVVNGGFDQDAHGWTANGASGSAEYQLTVDAGSAAGHLAGATTTLTEDLYPERPAAGEVIDVDLGDGLTARVPLSLASAGDHTVPAGDLPAAEARIAVVAGLGADDPDVRIADIVVAWGVLAHFYPYHDVIARPWPQVLDEVLAEELAAPDGDAHLDVVRHLIVDAEDGHGMVVPDGRVALPLTLAEIDGAIAVTGSAAPAIARGDVVIAVDGVPAADGLAAARALASGSPQWRTVVGLAWLGAGPDGSTARLTIEHDGARADVSVTRSEGATPAPSGPAVAEVRPGIWVVDLSRADGDDVEARAAALAAARGIVFDLRGYPSSHGVLAHLLDAPEHSQWMHIAHVIRPALPGVAPPAWSSFGWDLEPAAPRYRGKVAFVTGPGAISYAESVMGYVESLGLPIVGGPTAGTNGNVRMVRLPSGATFAFTGMKVTRHDGTRSHLQGIVPTVPVTPTLAGLRAGKDEVLERALALVDGGS